MRILLSIVSLILFLLQSYSQDEILTGKNVDGVYLNATDFRVNKIINPTDQKHKDDKIKLKQFFISPEIEFIEQGNAVELYKDSIFAIHLVNGKNYRFINRTPCLIADTSYMYIYTLATTRTEYKKSGPKSWAKEVPVTFYYFSTGDHKTVYLLTLNNVDKYVLFPKGDDSKLNEKYKCNAMLTEINPASGRFLINEFLKDRSLKQ
jgi:hypothetical protein